MKAIYKISVYLANMKNKMYQENKKPLFYVNLCNFAL